MIDRVHFQFIFFQTKEGNGRETNVAQRLLTMAMSPQHLTRFSYGPVIPTRTPLDVAHVLQSQKDSSQHIH